MPENYFDQFGEPNTEVSVDPAATRVNYFDQFGEPDYRRPEQATPISDDYGWGIGMAFRRGFERIAALPDVAQGDYEELAGHFRQMKEYAQSPEDQKRMQELQETDGWWEGIVYLTKNPALTFQVAAESLPMMAGPIIGGAVGGVAGSLAGPVGTAVGTKLGAGVGSGAIEYLNSITDFFADEGVNTDSGAELKAAFADPELMAGAREFAAKRGMSVGVFDTLSFALAGKLYKPLAGATNSRTRKILAGTADLVGIQAGGGMAGEATAQLVTEGEITDKPAVLLEGFAELAPGVVETAVSSYFNARKLQGEADAEASPLAALDVAEETPPMDDMPAPGDELDTAVDDALETLGSNVNQASEAVQAMALEELDQMDAEQEVADIEAAQIAANEARAVPMLEAEMKRDAQIQRQQVAGEAAQLKQETQEGKSTDRDTEAGFEAIEAERQEEAYQTELAKGEAAGIGVGRAQGTMLGEAMQRAQQVSESETGVPVVRDEGPALVEPKPTKRAQSVTPSIKIHSLLEYMGRERRSRDQAGKPKLGAKARLNLDAFVAEGVDPAAAKSPEIKYRRRSPFVKGETGRTPDDVAEFLNENEYPNPYDDGPWTASHAAQAVIDEVNDQGRTYHPSSMENRGAREAYEEEYDRYSQERDERAARASVQEWDIEAGGVQAHITEDPTGRIEVDIDGDITVTERKKGQSNRQIVEDITGVRGKKMRFAAEKMPGEDTLVVDAAYLDPNVRDQTIYGSHEGKRSMFRITQSGEVRGRPSYTVAVRDSGGESFTAIGQIHQRPANKDGLQWAQLDSAGKEIGERWHTFGAALSQFPGVKGAGANNKLTAGQRKRFVEGKAYSTEQDEFISYKGDDAQLPLVSEEKPTAEVKRIETPLTKAQDIVSKMNKFLVEKKVGAEEQIIEDENLSAEVQERLSDEGWAGNPLDLLGPTWTKGDWRATITFNDEGSGSETYTLRYENQKPFGPRDDVPADTGVKGDLFAEDANKQVDIEDVSAAKTTGIDEKKFNEIGTHTLDRVFESTVDKKNRKGIDILLKNEGNEYMSMEEADKKVQEWEDHAIAQRSTGGPQDHKDNFNRVILSLFDTTGTWANPYALAGYDVRVIDIKNGVDIQDFSSQYLEELFDSFGGKEVYGVLAACPCTTFSNSGTRWRTDRHDNADPVESRKIIEEMWGTKAAEAKNDDGTWMYATANEYANELVAQTMRTLEYYRPKFWALENPEGRIESSSGLPGTWRTGFQPHNFGEPYTKRTLLFGEFNEDLPTANVEPTEGSKMHKMPPSAGRAAARAETPVGFSYSFFMANNYLDTLPLERTKKDYWYVEGAIEEAFKAGVTEEQIRDNVYKEESYDPDSGTVEEALTAIRGLIEKGPPESTPTPPAAPTETESETEAREEREAIQGEEVVENEELGEIPGWDDIHVEAQTSPENDQAVPSKAQKEAGNYKMAHITLKGMPITIENPAGSSRSGRRQPAHYGYIKLTEGKDGDHLDVFVNPKIQTDYNNKVYIIDQMDQKSEQFDEHKVMLGYTNQLAAVRAYKQAYDKGWKVGPITETDMATFKKWSSSRAKLTRPASGDAFFGQQSRESGRASKGATQDLQEVGRDYRYADTKDLINAPNALWAKKLLGTPTDPRQGTVDTTPANMLVSRLLEMEASQREVAAADATVQAYRATNIVTDTAQLAAKMPGAEVTILESYKDAPTIVKVTMEARDMTGARAVTDPETGNIYMFADQISDANDAQRVFVHEATHKGLRVAFGEQLDPLLQNLYNNVPKKHQKQLASIVDRYRLDVDSKADQLEAAEELIAHIAETNPKADIVKKFIAAVRRALRGFGVDLGTWTDNDIAQLISEAQGSLSRRGNRIGGITFDEDVTIEDTGEVFTIEENAEEKLLQIEKRKGVVSNLKACL